MDYPGKGIFVITVERERKIKHVWLVLAESCEDAEQKFRELDRDEQFLGEPIIQSGEEISSEPLEFERGVSQMW
jgi:hypothetical protein